MHEGNYQLLYYIFLDSFRSPEQTLMFRHFLKQLYCRFVQSYIDQKHYLIRTGNFLTNSLYSFFSFRMIQEQILTFLGFSLLFQYFLQIYKCPYYIHYQPLYIQQNKKLKKTALCRLKFKTIFFIYTHNLQAQNSLIN